MILKDKNSKRMKKLNNIRLLEWTGILYLSKQGLQLLCILFLLILHATLLLISNKSQELKENILNKNVVLVLTIVLPCIGMIYN